MASSRVHSSRICMELVMESIITFNSCWSLSPIFNKEYKIKPGTFNVILVGKDGSEKHRSVTVLQPQKLFTIIDAMPMRRSEMKKNEWPYEMEKALCLNRQI